jgi:hypothetical protein
MKLTLLGERFAVCRLPPAAALPPWATSASFLSIARTPDELSIVCDDANVPADIQAERGWRCLKVEGPIPFSVVGLAARLTTPLATAGISVFFVSTFDTDYLLVQEPLLNATLAALASAGFAASATD